PANRPRDAIAAHELASADLGGRDVDVVVGGLGVREAQEARAVGEQLDDALDGRLLVAVAVAAVAAIATVAAVAAPPAAPAPRGTLLVGLVVDLDEIGLRLGLDLLRLDLGLGLFLLLGQGLLGQGLLGLGLVGGLAASAA